MKKNCGSRTTQAYDEGDLKEGSFAFGYTNVTGSSFLGKLNNFVFEFQSREFELFPGKL